MASRHASIALAVGLLATACGADANRSAPPGPTDAFEADGVIPALAPGSDESSAEDMHSASAPAEGMAGTVGTAETETADGAESTDPEAIALDSGADVASDPADPPEPEPAETPAEPPAAAGVDPVASNASDRARNLLGYLYSIRGQKMLSGQMESTWMRGGADYEVNYLEAVTGRLPAIRGLDFIEWDGVAERAIDWWNAGGIVNIRWHWGAPTHGRGYEASQEQVDIDRVLTPGTAEYQSMMDGLERTATELEKLRDADVPVLWTPFHELNGDWFWWGKGSARQFIELWRFMFEYFDETRGLNNLLWVLGYTGQPDAAWYPGRDYVDIAGADAYARTTAPRLGMFDAVVDIVGPEMPVAYHECGLVPDPDQARSQGAHWAWFMTWHTGWLTDENSVEHLRAVYAHDFVVTRDELPNLR